MGAPTVSLSSLPKKQVNQMFCLRNEIQFGPPPLMNSETPRLQTNACQNCNFCNKMAAVRIGAWSKHLMIIIYLAVVRSPFPNVHSTRAVCNLFVSSFSGSLLTEIVMTISLMTDRTCIFLSFWLARQSGFDDGKSLKFCV